MMVKPQHPKLGHCSLNGCISSIMTKQFRTLPSSVLYDEKITGYTATGMTYDMDAQNKIAERYGIEAYLEDFSDWFDEHTDGACQR